ncbi:MAG: hypothetical protein O2955_20595 [Planctomycetota bacterium]|nr:hypothetical protein [Planctomycetota bacterium]MDA1214909.1 hypothetical protein [Planctomycetota bacterium]
MLLLRWSSLLVSLAITSLALPLLVANDDTVMIGSTKRLTWDDSLFESSNGIRFEMHEPHRTGEKNLIADKPYESWQMGGMSSLLHEEGKFRLWYGVSHGIRNGEEYAVAYAESDDGITWTKPSLGLIEYNGSTDNNLVVAYSSVIGQVFRDPHAEADEKYKMLVAIYATKEDSKSRYLTMLSSPDGIRWTEPEKNIVPEGDFALDTQSQAYWDRDRESYVLFTRMGPWRQVGRSESTNPFSFPAPVNVMAPAKPEQADFYQAGVTKYEEAADAYFALVPVFFHPGDASGNPVDGNPPFTVNYAGNPITVVAPDTLDIHLFTSNDSVKWERRGDHYPFIGLGPDGEFDSRSLYPGVGYAVVGNEIWLYYSAYDCTHIESLDGKTPFEKYLGVITRATLRLDGFVSATAGHDGAEIVTKPLVFTGDHLELNVDCSAGGQLNVELQTVDGKPIEGYTLEESDRVYHNNIKKTVTWKGNADLSNLRGQQVRMKLVMKDCRLYAFRFGE